MKILLGIMIGMLIGVSFVMDTIHLNKITDFQQKAIKTGLAEYDPTNGKFKWTDPKLRYLMGDDKIDTSYPYEHNAP